MLSHTSAPPGFLNSVYPEAQRVDDGIDAALSGSGSTHLSHVSDNMTLTHQPVVIVRAEEALILVMVLILWIAAIALFFNRWGKIRMLEPYQPKFIQQHRPSCPLVDAVQVQHRSFSKFNINGNDVVLSQPHHFLHHPHYQHQHMLRPRQNSVFVASSMVTLPMNPPRKVKSAFDLNNLVSSDPALNRSALRLDRNDMRRSSFIPEHMRPRTDSRNNSICSTTKNAADSNADRIVPIKSGVLDFRRNSMLIINNLAEEIAPAAFHRNYSFGGSNLNLTPEIPQSVSPRRNSVIPPYAKFKPKTITTGKTSKSLDCDRSGQFVSGQTINNSAQNLLSEVASCSSEFPKIVETYCPTPPSSQHSSPAAPLSPTQPQPQPQPLSSAARVIDANGFCSSQVNLLASDHAYYYDEQPSLDPARNVSADSLNQHRLRISAYKVTNV